MGVDRCTVLAVCLLLLAVTVHASEQRSGAGEDGQTLEAEHYMMVEDVLSGIDYYRLLQVGRNATSKDIRKAFRSLSLKLHPDKVASLPEEERRSVAIEYEHIIRAKHVLGDPSLREVYDTMLRHGIPWVERYYNRYAYRYGAPRTSPFTVILILVGLLTVMQYLYKHYRFRRAVRAVKRSQRYQTAVKKLEYSTDADDAEDEADSTLMPKISIHGIHPPQLDDLLPVQAFTLPYSICTHCTNLVSSPSSMRERGLKRALELGYTEEEYEDMVHDAQRRRQKILSSSKYKRYKRMGKKMAQKR